jgi:hypothetical protein
MHQMSAWPTNREFVDDLGALVTLLPVGRQRINFQALVR